MKAGRIYHSSGAGTWLPFLQQYLGDPYHGEHCTVFLYHDQRLRTVFANWHHT